MRRIFPILTLILLPAIASPAEKVQGWRTDGTGVYLEAKPPLKWSKDTNVLWATELPASNSIPVVVGEKIFVGAEPTSLVCLRLSDGKVLWQREHNYELIAPKGEWAKAQVEIEQVKKLNDEARTLQREMGQIRKQLKNNEITEADAQKKLDALKEKVDAIKKRIEGLELAARWSMPRAHGHTGYSTPTPTTDGAHVWAHFGNGVTACYDLDGNQKWIKFPQKPRDGFGHTSSPVLVGDLLILHVQELIALNAKTGKEVWRARCGGRFGTPQAVRVGKEMMILTANGDLVRASDGEQLIRGRSGLGHASPIVVKNRAYFMDRFSRAFHLPRDAKEADQMKQVWSARLQGGRFIASPILSEGLIYVVNNDRQLYVLNAETGKVLYDKTLDLRGSVYPSLTLAGKYLYVSSSNGTTIVLEKGEKYREVERNELEPFSSSPMFHEGRLYLRTRKHLYCIGTPQ